MPAFERQAAAELEARLREPRRFIQVVAGPRQVGKTTLVQQAVGRIDVPAIFRRCSRSPPPPGGWPPPPAGGRPVLFLAFGSIALVSCGA